MLIHIVHIFCMFVQLVYISRAEDGAENPLVKLIELQTEHCTAASLCTFAAKGESSPHQNESCCFACSCEAECTRHGNCCPDYHLLDTIGRDVSYSISEFSERLTNVNVTKDSRLTCVEASEPNFRKIHERSEVSYKMIASCPANFLGNPDILNKCNEPKAMTKFENDLFIPVTSLKSGTTYKNMYCFFCNEELHERTDAAIWTTTLSCDNSYHREVIEVTPHEFFTSTMQGGVYYCNLVFSPNSVIRSYFDISRCEMVDIAICPDGSNKQLDKICNSFHLPVTYFTNPWSYKRYRNIACFLCNVETPFNPVCNIEIFIKNPYGLELNIQLNESNAVIHSDENQQDVLNVDVIEKEDNECRTGFIRNTSTTNEISCSRVLCPWNFYIHEGVCIPTFTRLHNLMFRAMLEVRRAEVFGQAMLDEIRVNYMKKIETIGSLLFRQFSFGLWEKGNDYDFLVVAFTSEDESYNYLDMMKLYALFLERVCLLKISAKSSLVTVSTFQTRSPGQDIETIDFMVPKPTMIRKFETPDSSMKWLELFVTHLCYRVTVPHSEKDYYIENHYTSIAIQGTDYGMIKVCVDDMYGKTTDTRSGFMFGDTCAKTTVDFIQNKQNYKTTNIVNDRNNNDNNDANKNNNNGDNNVIDDENNNNSNNNNGENNVIDDKNNNNTNNNDDGNENINRNDKKVSNDVLRTPDTSEKWEWSLDLSTGLFVGGVALVATVAVVVVVILRKRKQRAEVNEEYNAQESQGK